MPKFKPTNPFTWFAKDTDGASHFGKKTKTSQFISDLIKLHIDMGGLDINVYRLKGTFVQDENVLGTAYDTHGKDTDDEGHLFDIDDTRENPFGPDNDGPTDVGSFLGVQDTILNENRDREYDFDEIPVLRATYTVSQNELEYARFGMALANDVLTLEIHTEEMEKQLERRVSPGDVIEMPHLREVGIDGRVANKWYEVSSIVWSPSGYDPAYARHVSAVTVRPLRHQQEFLDIFNRKDEYGKTLAQQASNVDAMMATTQANQELAREYTNTTWYDTTVLYWCPDDPDTPPVHELFTDGSTPPNGLPVEQGPDFPVDPQIGEWFVRVDFVPNRLFRYTENRRWKLQEVDHKREWQPYNWVSQLRNFMSDRSDSDNNRNYELKSIHDVLTERQDRSNLAHDGDNNSESWEDKENDGELKG